MTLEYSEPGNFSSPWELPVHKTQCFIKRECNWGYTAVFSFCNKIHISSQLPRKCKAMSLLKSKPLHQVLDNPALLHLNSMWNSCVRDLKDVDRDLQSVTSGHFQRMAFRNCVHQSSMFIHQEEEADSQDSRTWLKLLQIWLHWPSLVVVEVWLGFMIHDEHRNASLAFWDDDLESGSL